MVLLPPLLPKILVINLLLTCTAYITIVHLFSAYSMAGTLLADHGHFCSAHFNMMSVFDCEQFGGWRDVFIIANTIISNKVKSS